MKTLKIIGLLIVGAFAGIGAMSIANADIAASFTDVPQDAYYHDAVFYWAHEGLLNGFDDFHFKPEDPVTRGQMAYILKSYDSRGVDYRSQGGLAQLRNVVCEGFKSATLTGDAKTSYDSMCTTP